MNISHRSLWNSSLGAWVAVSEITRACGKRTLRGIAAGKTHGHGPLRPLNTALILAGLLAASGSVIAQTTDWVTGGAGNWNTGANWSNGVPTVFTVVRLYNVGDQVTLNSSGTAQGLEIESPGEVIVTTGGALIVGDLISLGRYSGAGGVAKLTIQGGGTVSAARFFAGDGLQPGNVTVTGAGSSLTVAPSGQTGSNRFQFGAIGTGELHIDAGANVTVNGTRTLHLGSTGNGTLFIGNGAGAGTLTADSVIFGTTGSSVQFNHTGTTTFAAAISGNGFLTKTGAGTTTLTGANTYTGGTSINAGTLALGAGGSLAATGAVALNAPGTGFDISASSNQTIGGLAGVVGSAVSLGGNTLTFGTASDQTFAGAIGGSGGLVKQGAGTQILSGINNYTSGTTVSAGTLQGNSSSLQGAITNNAAVTFDQATAGTYAGVMSGSGSLTKLGTSNLTLSGTNTYNGATTVSAGLLTVNGSIANSALTVNSGGTLGGSGTVGSTTIASGGALAPGNSIGSLTVNGDLTLASGSLMNFEFGAPGTSGAAGSSDQVQVNGNLALNGATLNVTDAGSFGPGLYRLFNYTGTLSETNGGINLGTVPGAATNLSIQKLTAQNQINLINTSGLTLSYWNANNLASPTQAGGGTGTWSNTASTWTDDIGSMTAPMTPQPGFAIFTGAPGTVTVDNGPGNVQALGLQFASSAYTLSGDTLTLGDTGTGSAIVRVGDGNAASANYVATINNVIAGSHGLTKTDAGTLVLTGANTYTGSTAINGGTLSISSDANLGNTNNALSLNGGTLATTATLTTTRATTLEAGGGTLAVSTGTTLTHQGVIDGTGSLSKTGTGTLILSGTNSFSGALNIAEGNITTASSGALGNSSGANISSGASLSLGANTSLASLSGAGGVSIANGNTLSVGGTSTSSTFDGSLSGGGALSKTGSGQLILSGVNTYSGATTVSAGLLSVNGSIANSAVTVNSGATLGGTGTVGSTSIAAGGVLAPGNSIGTLTVNGSLNLAAGSIYRVEVDAAGNNDRINVTGAPGTATLNGGTVDVQASAGTYAANTTYTILNATGGRTGAFSGVTSNLAFLTPTLGYDANNVFLSLARNDTSYSSVAVTRNQIATATALQNANAGATGDMGTVQTALTGLSATQARAAYDSLSGAGLVALRNAGSSFAAGFGSQLQARLGAVQGGGSGLALSNRPVLLAANDHVSDFLSLPASDTPQKFSLAGGASSDLPSRNDPSKGFWLRGSGGYQNTDSDGNAAASKLRSGSLSAGFDAELREGLRAGIALSSGASRLSTDNNESGKSRGTALALYGSYAAGPWNFKGSASVGWNSNQMDRSVVVGAIKRVASSDFDSTTLSAYGEAAYSLAMNGGWTLQPLAALSLSRNKADGFTETGAGALNLQVAGQTVNSTKSLLGAKAAFDAGKLRLEPRVLWAHEFGNLNTPMTAQFQGAANASPFQVSGVALKRDTLILGLGASGSISKNFDLFADVQAEHNSLQRNVAVLVGLRGRW
jgi:autotransporter-associated beta strand protein